jgi:sulfate transport system permease protein
VIAVEHDSARRAAPARRAGDGPVVRRVLIGAALVLTLLLLVAPILVILARAFSGGIGPYAANVLHPETLHAVRLTLLTVAVVLPVNLLFGLAAAWAITRFRFRGRRLLLTLVELPFSISPIVAGTVYLFLYGSQGLFGPWLAEQGVRVMFSFPAIVLVSLFVTSPFVARELVTLMQAQGSEEEEAALTLGASGPPAVLARHPAQRPLGAALRRHPLHRPHHRRVRRGLRGLGQRPRARPTPCRSRSSCSTTTTTPWARSRRRRS